eukprot:Tbor_TRINITY_DN5844_c0_g1::TRINITY_DN5844_c0_g1_i1::g.6764::m.6764
MNRSSSNNTSSSTPKKRCHIIKRKAIVFTFIAVIFLYLTLYSLYDDDISFKAKYEMNNASFMFGRNVTSRSFLSLSLSSVCICLNNHKGCGNIQGVGDSQSSTCGQYNMLFTDRYINDTVTGKVLNNT